MPDDPAPHEPGARPSPRLPEPDAHGQAALILAEATLHALVETRRLTLDQAIGVVRTASEVKVEVAEESGESEGRMQRSVQLLAAIERSLVASVVDPDRPIDPHPLRP